MNIWMKRAMTAAGLTAALATPLSGLASDGTITFTGAVTASSCVIKVDGGGSGDGTVALPIVDTAALTNATADRKTAAGTFFSVEVSGCATATDIGSAPAAPPTTVQIYFEAGPNVDQVTGGLINTVLTGSNVEVNLYNASAATKVGTQIKPGTNTNQPLTQAIGTGGTQWFYAGYSTAAAGGHAALAGAVSTSITYSLIYN